MSPSSLRQECPFGCGWFVVRELPRSGKPEELLAKYGLDAAAIVAKVKSLV